MFLRHRYQSPDTLQSTQYLEKESVKGTSPPSLTRYSSAKLLNRLSADHRASYSNLRKRIEQYSYNISDLIGEGYTSRVFKASNDMSNELFAVKVVELKKYSSSNREMLESEVSILRVMDHPNIIKCHDVYLTNNNCYIITEYCEGGDLLGLLKKHSRGETISDGRMSSIMRDLLSGFRYLVEKGIVHRDIKPANIFFRNGVAKIADFGFAKRLTVLKEK
jgi:serine/threonine-protein kinase ULK/ATG1